MTMYQFMVNAFYMLCGVACVAASVVIVYICLLYTSDAADE